MKKAVLSFEGIQPKRTPLVEGGVYQYEDRVCGITHYILGRVSRNLLCLINLQSGNRFLDPIDSSRMEEVLQDFVLVSEEIHISLC